MTLVFRRIHGRIVPIQKKDSGTVSVAKGVGLTTAGVGTALVSGNVAARATQQAARFRHEAQWWTQKAKNVGSGIYQKRKREALEKAGQMSFEFKIKTPKYHRFTKAAMNSAIKSDGFRFFRKGVKGAGLAASAALIGVGLTKIYEGSTGKKADAKKEAIAAASGTASVFALNSSYAHRMLGGGAENLFAAIKFGLKKAKIR